MNNSEFIQQHRHDDVRRLALSKPPAGVDLRWCLEQIAGWQVASRKLPQWAAVEGILYPPRLALEQCSSCQTANYKRTIVERLLPTPGHRRAMVDCTGGLGVDFVALAPLFRRATYCETQSELCSIARQNFPLLGVENATVLCADGTEAAFADNAAYSLIYLDPARRSSSGRKVFNLKDCMPDVAAISEELLSRAPLVMLKLSPMLDMTMALRELGSVAEVHVVSLKGECKELLLVLSAAAPATQIYCINLDSTDEMFVCAKDSVAKSVPEYAHRLGKYLLEPNASVLKAGVQNVVGQRHGLTKLHRDSHLFTADRLPSKFPGRTFLIEQYCRFAKAELAEMLADTRQANLTLRNFPATADKLRKQLHLKDGGDTFLFATTLADGTHVLIKCRKT